MTSSEMPSRIAFKRPFAESGTKSDFADTTGSTVNYPDGFPANYSAPHTSGGKFVLRGDINRIGNLATNDLFYHKCGGLNTFDSEFAAKIGGYPKGAVLKYMNGMYIYDVVSLVDNNMFDFVANNLVDGINWAFCNKEAAPTSKILAFTSTTPIYPNTIAPVGGTSSMDGQILGVFKSPASGVVTADFDFSLNIGIETSTGWLADFFGIFVQKLTSGYTEIPQLVYSTDSSQSTISQWSRIVGNNSSVTGIDIAPVYANFGDEYVVGAIFNEYTKTSRNISGAYQYAIVNSVTNDLKIYIG